MTRTLLLTCLSLCSLCSHAIAEESADSYASAKATTAALQEQHRGMNTSAQALELVLITHMQTLFSHWYGTRWGLGAPQTSSPGEGKINCGMFVGRTLVDAGFRLNHIRLQRQPAELIIKSLSPANTIKRWRNKPIATFIKEMKASGPGLYIIGLDFHVGFILVEPSLNVRFIHASYVTHTVLNEDAANATPITTSKYRVVGKILQPNMAKAWLRNKQLKVKGTW